MPSRNNPAKRLLFSFLGLVLCVIPVTVTIFSYFPLWIAREDASILSGVSLLLAATAAVPLYKHLRHALKSPSAPFMWFVFFILFLILSKIADEMTVIAFVGFVTNLVGSLFFKLSARYGGEEKDGEGRV